MYTTRSKMFPSKNMLDYMSEMNRLFPRTSENEMPSPNFANTNYMHSPFNTSTIANRSSSSADSISPESFPDMSSPPFRPRFEMTNQGMRQSLSETPFPTRRHRPIIGRKILNPPDQSVPSFETPVSLTPFETPLPLSPAKSMDIDSLPIWQEQANFSHTPPNPKIFFDQKNYTQNVFYELFPSENKGLEFRTPVKSSPRTSSFSICSANISPSSSTSPVSSNLAQRFATPPPTFRRNIMPNSGPGSSKMSPDMNTGRMCSFCRKNGETPMVYMTHTVKERVGNKHVVTCPILRSHVCSTCGVSGDDAHTITYCPVLRSSNNGRPLQSTTITLKNTRVKSNGRKRF